MIDPASAAPSPVVARLRDWTALMIAAQAGDKRAYGQLLQAITPWLRSLARRAGVAPADIEDAVQNVLIAIHSVRHTYDPERPLAPWLAGVARFRLIDHLRQQGRRLSREVNFEPEHETFSVDETNDIETSQDHRRLHAAVAQLPAGQKQAIEYLKMKELSLKETAALTGQSEASLKVSVHRAVKRLRTLLGER